MGGQRKPLSEMTNEELWALFPVILTPHDPQWGKRYETEKERLTRSLGMQIAGIRHIGSTAVEGLIAKPTIDILLEVHPEAEKEKLIRRMEAMGYIYSARSDNPPPHRLFMKGYTQEGFRGQTFHVHVRYEGDWDEPYFCRYLQDHPEKAREYGLLKEHLQKQYTHDRDAYTDAKGDFIRETTRLARKFYVKPT